MSDFLADVASLSDGWARCDMAALLLRSAYGEARAAATLGVSIRTLHRRCTRAKRTIRNRAESFQGEFCHVSCQPNCAPRRDAP